MHKYESYGSWENCSEYWNNVNENDLIEITNNNVNENKLIEITNNNVNKNSLPSTLENKESFSNVEIKQKSNVHILNNKFVSKKLIINNINNNIKNYGEYKHRSK
jgi:hypothetical protein